MPEQQLARAPLTLSFTPPPSTEAPLDEDADMRIGPTVAGNEAPLRLQLPSSCRRKPVKLKGGLVGDTETASTGLAHEAGSWGHDW
jgi:hypothetical protein